MNQAAAVASPLPPGAERVAPATISIGLDGTIVGWDVLAQRLYGYTAEEIIGRSVSFLYPADRLAEMERTLEQIRQNEAVGPLTTARRTKEGRAVPMTVTVSPIANERGSVVAAMITARPSATGSNVAMAVLPDGLHLQRLNARLEDLVQERTQQLEAANKELEAFAYSVSHDLRAPLRAIDGFSAAVVEEHSAGLDPQGRHYLLRVRGAVQRMSQLIDDLLELSRVSRAELQAESVDLSACAREVVAELQQEHPARRVEITIQPGLVGQADPRLLRIALKNLLDNAWKFTRQTAEPRVEFGRCEREGAAWFFVRDNGAGFEMAYVNKLFAPFQRLHSVQEYEGTGIGLATVQRIIRRHRGDVWAEGQPGQGATFYFSLPPAWPGTTLA